MKTLILCCCILFSTAAFSQINRTTNKSLSFQANGSNKLRFKVINNGANDCSFGYTLEYLKSDGKVFFSERLSAPSGSFQNKNRLISGENTIVEWEANSFFFNQASEVRVSVNWVCQ